jgi:amino acid adenylation domain-containing protein
VTCKNTENLVTSLSVESQLPVVEFPLAEVEKSIPDRFKQQVDRDPDKIGIKTLTYALTYAEIDRFSGQVAREIIDRCGVNKGETIGLCFGRDESILMTILGVLTAGKVAVALDTTQHPDRLRYLLTDARPVSILTNTQNLALVRELAPTVRILNIDDLDRNPVETDRSIQPNIAISPDDLACIIYTSGSTGQPKGTVYSHRCLLHLVKRYTDTLQIRSIDRMLLISSSGHMAGMNTILRGLLNGATVFPFDLQHQGVAKLVEWLNAEKITLYNSVPTIFRQLVGSLDKEQKFPYLRILLLGGEIVTKRDVDLFRQHFAANCTLVNNVGCTEFSCYRQYFVDRNTQVNDNILPVGYPVVGAEVLLLDEDGRSVGFNHPGEIAIDSRYLALGYWQQPTLTATKFLPSPQGAQRRIYRTGDLGKMLPDGCLIHLGRKDARIEINGSSVEIVEIEMTLLASEWVKQAAVIVTERQSDRPKLIAYVAIDLSSIECPTERDVQDFLKLNLPALKIPIGIVMLDVLPLLPSGKIDLRTLTDST